MKLILDSFSLCENKLILSKWQLESKHCYECVKVVCLFGGGEGKPKTKTWFIFLFVLAYNFPIVKFG